MAESRWPVVMTAVLPSRPGMPLLWTGRFDRVLNWSTAFGYFDDTTNRAALDGSPVCRGRLAGWPWTWTTWLLAAGFTAVTGYGEDGRPLTSDHKRMVIIAGLS
jgi:hypothetical protein